ncbi:MAG: ATP-grasp domain-containing protein [Saccharofermentanales bacterium]|jgi:biotin carboxylase
MFEEARGKKLLIIGAETNIMHIVTQAKEMGVYTIVTERGSDYSTTSAKSIADEAWDIDYSDLETLVQQSQRVGINGVISGYSEGKVLYAARLSQLLQTPFYVTPEQIELTRNKRHFKELCSEYGVPIPIDYCPSGSIDSLDRNAIKYPVIVKPADYGGRIGITICHCEEEIDNALDLAKRNSLTGTVVVEEYLKGIELTAIYTIADGEISLSIINDKYLSEEGNHYACLCDFAITPSKFYQLYLNSIDAPIKNLLRGIGVSNGLAGFQFIEKNGIIYAFEMGLRLNGGNDWQLLSAHNGINHMKMLINYSLTGTMGDSLEKDNPIIEGYMATYVMYVHSGVIGSFTYSGIEGHRNILDMMPFVHIGKSIPDTRTTQQRLISFKIRSETLEEMAETIRFIQERVHVKDANGRSLMFSLFDTKRLKNEYGKRV